MRILHVGKYYPPRRGGMETVLRDLAEGSVARGSAVRVIVAGDGVSPSVENIGPDGRGRLIRLPVPWVSNSQPLTPGLAGALRREIRDFEPDLVHLHLPNPLAALTWLTLERWPGLDLPPLVVWYHADITRQRLGGALAAPVVRRLLERAAGICVSTPGLKASSPFVRPHAERTRVIAFGIEPEPWASVEPRGNGPFLFVGRLVGYKGLGVLLEAVAGVPDAQLVLVGEGPLEEKIRREIRRPELSGRVRLAGPRTRGELARLMTDTRAVVLPSLDRSETFGLVQLEAMASGVPVIVSDVETGISAVGEPGVTGLVVPPGDVEALAAALAAFQEDPDRARTMGRSGRRLFQSKYRREAMMEDLFSWYDSVLGAGVTA